MATLISHRRLASALTAVLLAATTGCVNPFQPAKPENPTSAPVVPNFSTPDGLLNTIRLAIQNKGASGRNAYYDALGDSTAGATPSFYAVHDPAVVDAWRIIAQRDPPEPWWTWNEKRFYDYLISVLQQFTYTFQWSPDNTQPIDRIDDVAGTATLHRYYVLQATSADEKIQTIIAIGYADLTLQRVGGRWYLIRWEDRVDPNIGVNPIDTRNRTMGWRRLDSTAS
jgi:hypothetical protein